MWLCDNAIVNSNTLQNGLRKREEKKKERNDHMEVDSHSRKGFLKDYDVFGIFMDF